MMCGNHAALTQEYLSRVNVKSGSSRVSYLTELISAAPSSEKKKRKRTAQSREAQRARRRQKRTAQRAHPPRQGPIASVPNVQELCALANRGEVYQKGPLPPHSVRRLFKSWAPEIKNALPLPNVATIVTVQKLAPWSFLIERRTPPPSAARAPLPPFPFPPPPAEARSLMRAFTFQVLPTLPQIAALKEWAAYQAEIWDAAVTAWNNLSKEQALRVYPPTFVRRQVVVVFRRENLSAIREAGIKLVAGVLQSQQTALKNVPRREKPIIMLRGQAVLLELPSAFLNKREGGTSSIVFGTCADRSALAVRTQKRKALIHNHIPSEFAHAAQVRLQGHRWLLTIRETTPFFIKRPPNPTIAAIDYGFRNAVTVAISDGRCITFGSDRTQSLTTLRELDEQVEINVQKRIALQRRCADLKGTFNKGLRCNLHQRIRVLKRKAAEISAHRKGIQDSFHAFVAREVASLGIDILISPAFPVSALIRKNHRVMGPRATHDSLRWGISRLRHRIEYVAARSRIQVVHGDEEWTTATCPDCGFVNFHVGGCPRFTCRSCRYSGARDPGGAFSIISRAFATGGQFLRPLELEYRDEDGHKICESRHKRQRREHMLPPLRPLLQLPPVCIPPPTVEWLPFPLHLFAAVPLPPIALLPEGRVPQHPVLPRVSVLELFMPPRPLPLVSVLQLWFAPAFC